MHKQVLLLLVNLFLASTAFSQVKLKGFESSQCDKQKDPYAMKAHIVSQRFEGDVYVIRVATRANCCSRFVPSIKFSNGSLNLKYKEKGKVCKCMCCFYLGLPG